MCCLGYGNEIIDILKSILCEQEIERGELIFLLLNSDDNQLKKNCIVLFEFIFYKMNCTQRNWFS